MPPAWVEAWLEERLQPLPAEPRVLEDTILPKRSENATAHRAMIRR